MNFTCAKSALPALALCALFLAIPAGASAGPISGKWVGNVNDSNVDPPMPYEAKLKIDDKLKKGKISGSSRYANYDCRGDLRFERHPKRSDSWFFTEINVEGQCYEGGTIELELNKRRTKVDYFWSTDAFETTTSGKLKRVR